MVSINPKTALVIDADPAFRQYVTLRLEVLGFKVREAENPTQIREAVRRGDVDLVVSEFAVPGLEGLQLLQALEPAKRPVFLLTDWVMEDAEAFQEQTRVRAVISKKKRWEFFKQLETLGPTATVEAEVGMKPNEEKHILLIEDSPTIRNLVRRILEKEIPGCVIREAEEGRDAISEMAQKKVDLIVTDLQMPGMDGRTFLKMIRRNNLLKQKPVLVFSSGDVSDLKAEYKYDSCMEFLAKPSSPEEIMAAINRLWDCQSSPLRNFKK
jgi:CheY-like chemotaxis protein